MNLTSVKVGDIVWVDKKGRRFHGVVLEKQSGGVRFAPIERGITWTTATSREVKQAWHKSRQGSRAKATARRRP